MRAALKRLALLAFLNPAFTGLTAEPAAITAAQCRVQASPMVFSTYQIFTSSDTAGVGKLAYSCTASVPVRITLNCVTHTCKLQHGSSQANYEICLDPGCSVVWGDGSNGTQPFFDPSPPVNRPVMVYFYGRVSALQDLEAGLYSDTVSVTISW